MVVTRLSLDILLEATTKVAAITRVDILLHRIHLNHNMETMDLAMVNHHHRQHLMDITILLPHPREDMVATGHRPHNQTAIRVCEIT